MTAPSLADLQGSQVHAVLARLRQKEPVAWVPALGAWLVTRRDLALAAMRADRPYRSALTEPQALAELHHCAGSQFDPHVVRAFTAVVREPAADRAAA